MKNALYLTLVCLFSFCALTPTFADTLTSADAHYLKRAYSQAYKGYSEATKAGQIPEPRQKEVEYRSTVCLMHIKPGQTALKATLALVKKYPKTVWEARYLTLLGRIYWILPHTGVKRGDKLFRDLSQEGKRPNDRAVREENAEASRIDIGHAYDALEAARIRYSSLPSRAGLAQEEILLNVDFLYLMNSSMGQYERDGDPAVDNAPINTEAVYSPKWSQPHKRLYLYEQIKRLAGDVSALRKYRINAYYDEAVWLDSYHESSISYPRGSQEAKKPYPYESWKSIPLLEECLRTSPPCPERNLIRLQLGKLLMEARKPEDAARQTQTVLQAKPSAEITKIAKALLKAIYAPEIEWFKPASKNSDYEYNREVMLTNSVTTQPSPCPAGIPLPIREKDLYREVILLFSMR